jgi:hypothetical protein
MTTTQPHPSYCAMLIVVSHIALAKQRSGYGHISFEKVVDQCFIWSSPKHGKMGRDARCDSAALFTACNSRRVQDGFELQNCLGMPLHYKRPAIMKLRESFATFC